VYSTYLGGADEDSGYGMKVDGVGNTYVSGVTASTNFPVTAGSLRGTVSGVYDIFVTKLAASGAALVYSTYFGGSGFDSTDANLGLDVSGAVYITGETNSTDFPVPPAMGSPTARCWAAAMTMSAWVSPSMGREAPISAAPLSRRTSLSPSGPLRGRLREATMTRSL
jgi:hypothetical protein